VVAAGDATEADVPFAEGEGFDRRGVPGSGVYRADAVAFGDGRLEVEWSYVGGPGGVSSLTSVATTELSAPANWVLACP
jgi:hypothetical protein